MIGKVDLNIDLLFQIRSKSGVSPAKFTAATRLAVGKVDPLCHLSLIDVSQAEGKVLCTPRFCETVLPDLKGVAKTFSSFKGFDKIESISFVIRTRFEGSEDKSEQKFKGGLDESLVQSIARGRDIGPRKEDTERAYRQMLLAIKKIKPGDSDLVAYHNMMGNLYAQCLAFDKESGENDSDGAAFNSISMPDKPLENPKHEKNRVAVQSWLSSCNFEKGCKELIYADIVLHLGCSFLGLEPLFADSLQTKTITIFSDGLTILDEELEWMEQTTGGVLHPWTRKPLAPIIADNVPLKRLKKLVLDSLDAFKEKNPIQHDRFFEALQDASGKGGNWELMQALKNPKTGLLLTLGGVSTESEERISFKYFIENAVGKIEFEKKLSIVIQLAQLLERIHRVGIIYQYLCPENIYCRYKKESSGDEKPDVVEVYLNGFDQAAIESFLSGTKSVRTIGFDSAFHYMPPECFEGYQGDSRADIYCFGLVACELLMGQSMGKKWQYESNWVRQAKAMNEIHCGMQLASFKNEDFPQKVRGDLSSLIERCCSNLPQDRPSILEVENVLVECYTKLTETTGFDETKAN